VLAVGIGQTDAAIEAFRDALRLAPGMAAAQRGLMAAQTAKTRAQARAHALIEQARRNPSDARLQYNLGVAQARAGDSAAAMAAFEQAARLDPKLAMAHTNLALLLYVRGEYPGAWREVGLARAAGAEPPAEFLGALTRRMAPPNSSH